MSVKRYGLFKEDEYPSYSWIEEQSDGDYILKSDYAALESRYHALEGKHSELWKNTIQLEDEFEAMRNVAISEAIRADKNSVSHHNALVEAVARLRKLDREKLHPVTDGLLIDARKAVEELL